MYFIFLFLLPGSSSFGTLSFATNNLPTYMQITAHSEGVIHEASIYGECRKDNSEWYHLYAFELLEEEIK